MDPERYFATPPPPPQLHFQEQPSTHCHVQHSRNPSPFDSSGYPLPVSLIPGQRDYGAEIVMVTEVIPSPLHPGSICHSNYARVIRTPAMVPIQSVQVTGPMINSGEQVPVYHLGSWGWKRYCLYILLSMVFVGVLINSALIIWIITVISFSPDGIGRLKVSTGSDGNFFKLDGEAFLHQELYANNILSPQGKKLRVISSNEIKMNVEKNSSEHLAKRSQSQEASNRLFLTPTLVGGLARQLVIRAPDGNLLLMLDENDVHLAIDRLRVNNEYGIKFNCSIQVPSIESASGPLKIESLTRNLRLFAPKFITFNSTSTSISKSGKGNISIQSLSRVSFHSITNQINFNSAQIQFENLGTVYPSRSGSTYPGIKQLCLCQSGMFFMAPADGSCSKSGSICKKSRTVSNAQQSSKSFQ